MVVAVVDLEMAVEGLIRPERGLVAMELALLLTVLVQEFVDPEELQESDHSAILEGSHLEGVVIPVVVEVQRSEVKVGTGPAVAGCFEPELERVPLETERISLW